MDVNTTALTSWKVWLSDGEMWQPNVPWVKMMGLEPSGVSGMTAREHKIRHSKTIYKIRQEID